MNSKKLWRGHGLQALAVFSALTAMSLLNACGGGSSGSSGSPAKLSGTLTSTQSLKSFSEFLTNPAGVDIRAAAQASTIKCTTADNPPVTVTATVGTNGGFAVDLSSVSGHALTCRIYDANSNILGTFVFSNSNEKDLSGTAVFADTVSITGTTNVGTVTLDNGGQVTVDASSISSVGVGSAVTNPMDLTGTWMAGTPTFSLPPGVIGPCATQGNNCHGPTNGQKFYFLRLTGTVFTPDSTCSSAVTGNTFTASSTCSGTGSSTPAYGVMLWGAQSDFTLCGSKLGFTFDQAKAYAGIDFTNNGVAASGALTWSSTLPNTHTLINNNSDPRLNGWEDASATSSFEMDACSNQSLGGQNIWKCVSSDGTKFSLSAGWGCTDANNNPVQVQLTPTDWQSATGCTNGTTTVGGFTLNTNSCTVTHSGTQYKCGGSYGQFNTSDNSAVSNPGPFANKVIIGQGQACTTANTSTDAGKLGQLQCFSQAYYGQGQGSQSVQSFGRDDTGAGAQACVHKVETNWGSADSGHFLLNSGPDQALAQIMTERLNYLANNVAAFAQINTYYNGVQTQGQNGQNWTPCQVREKQSVTVTMASATSGVVKLETETHLLDTNATCVANASQLNDGQVVRMLFTITKQ